MKLPLMLSALLIVGCSARTTIIGENVDAGPPTTLTVAGRVCGTPPAPNEFPVKVVVLLSQSAVSCAADGPGVQNAPSFCERLPAPLGVTQPARVRAALRLMDQLSTNPAVLVAFVPFGTNVRGTWPTTPGARFARPDPTLLARISSLQAELEGYADVQGALTHAYALIDQDLAELERTTPAVRARTSYRVVLITTGPPTPRCSSVDNLTSYADDLRPADVWADSHVDLCNVFDPRAPNVIAGFVSGADRNQNGQLSHWARKLRGLETERRAGEVRVDARLLFDTAAVDACGLDCQQELDFGFLRSSVPVPAADRGAYAAAIARHTLQLVATQGGGAYEEATSATTLRQFSLDSFPLTSLVGTNVQKAFFLQPQRAIAVGGAWKVDDDGDGVANDDEVAGGSDPFVADTDGDGFDDGFERARVSEGFDVRVRDRRGCDTSVDPGCTPRDTDGDGLSQYAEAYLGTTISSVDSDLDGVPDGLEVRWGLDPRSPLDPAADSDGDGVLDRDELIRGSDPRFAEPAGFVGMQVTTQPGVVQSDGRVCYDFRVEKVPMVATSARPNVPAGVSLFSVWFAEGSSEARHDVSTWSSACFFARRDEAASPPALVPPNLSVSVSSSEFGPMPRSSAQRTLFCGGVDALAP